MTTFTKIVVISLFGFKVTKRICLGSKTKLGIVNMGIYLSGVKVVVPKKLLKRPYIYTVLQHKSRCSMPQLM